VPDDHDSLTLRHQIRDNRRSLAILAVVVVVVFAPAMGHRFTLDSRFFMQEDPRVSGFLVAEMFTTDWWNAGARNAAETEARGGLYRPLSLLWLSCLRGVTSASELADDRSVPVNLGNLLLHVVGVQLRFLLFLALLEGMKGARRWAFVGALVLAIHPVSLEAVATQVGAAEGLSVVFTSASLLLALQAMERGGVGRWTWHGLLLFLALLAKESAVALPGVVFLMGWLACRRSLRDSLIGCLPSVGALVGWMAVRMAVLGEVASVGDPVFAQMLPASAVATALAVIGSYDLPALVLPVWLHPNPTLQELPPAADLTDPRSVLGLGVVVLLILAVACCWRRAPRVAFGLAFLGGTLLPVTNLVVPIGAVAASRFLYLPLTGLALALAALGCRAEDRPRLRWLGRGLAAWMVLFPGACCLLDVPIWSDQRTLFAAAAERYPEAAQAHFQVGTAEVQRAARGEPSALARAQQAFDRAMGAPLVAIPGRPGIYHEDSIEVGYQASVNRSGLAARQLPGAMQRGDRAAFEDLVSAADRALQQAEDMTRHGLELAAGPQGASTDWLQLCTDTLAQRVDLRLQRAGLLTGASRTSALAGVASLVERLERLDREGLKTALARLRLRAVRSQVGVDQFTKLLEDLFRRALNAPVHQARPVVQAHVDHLRSRSRHVDAARAFLEAWAAEVVTPTAQELSNAALTAMGGRGERVRKLARRALRWTLDHPAGVDEVTLTRVRQALER